MDHYSAVDRAHLAVLRAVNWADVVDPLERVRVVAAVARRLDEMADQQARVAVTSGASMGAVGKALGRSRQAAWRRYAATLKGSAAA